MKIILNKCFGGFSLSDYAEELMGFELDSYYDPDDIRTDAQLIAYMEAFGSKRMSDSTFSKLVLVEIPDTFTDYEVNDYDGWEHLTYVVDGKLYHA